jgi:hypothetical protein
VEDLMVMFNEFIWSHFEFTYAPIYLFCESYGALHRWNEDPVCWQLFREQVSYSACQLGPTVSYWFQC